MLIALASIAFVQCVIVLAIAKAVMMLTTILASVTRLKELLPQLINKLAAVESENAILKARIAELEATEAELPQIDADLVSLINLMQPPDSTQPTQ